MLVDHGDIVRSADVLRMAMGSLSAVCGNSGVLEDTFHGVTVRIDAWGFAVQVSERTCISV